MWLKINQNIVWKHDIQLFWNTIPPPESYHWYDIHNLWYL